MDNNLKKLIKEIEKYFDKDIRSDNPDDLKTEVKGIAFGIACEAELAADDFCNKIEELEINNE